MPSNHIPSRPYTHASFHPLKRFSLLVVATIALLLAGAYCGSMGGVVGALSVPVAVIGELVILWCTIFW